MPTANVLIVEDELKLAQLLASYLKNSGYSTTTHHDGSQVVEFVKQAAPDLILLDLMLPVKDGMDICKEIRQFSTVPIIIVTARVEEIDRLLGLELGADDYICKPFSPREVVARVKAVLRRFYPTSTEETLTPSIQLDTARYKVLIQQQDLSLTAVEFQLFKILFAKPGHIYSREQLMNQIYPDNRVVGDRTIDSHIKKLRKKMASATHDQEFIHSVYGVGYKFEVAEKT